MAPLQRRCGSAVFLAFAFAAAVIVLLSASLACAGSSAFDAENPIRSVTDRPDLSSLESGILRALGSARRALSFARFARRYAKRYDSVEEVRRRFGIFVENLELIRTSNRMGRPYTLGVNEFADMTWEEFRAQHLGAAQTCSATLKGNHKVTDVVLPDTKDWREAGIVSPVKNQGSCGSCWTFSTTGALEAAYTQLTGKSISLSEQQLVDCATDFNNFGCHGGLPSQAYEYIKYNGGLDTEETYPYLGVNSICKFKPESVGVKVVDSVNITLVRGFAIHEISFLLRPQPSNTVCCHCIKNTFTISRNVMLHPILPTANVTFPDYGTNFTFMQHEKGAEDELKHAVGVVRPVSVAFEVVKGFRFYKSGVYTSDTCGSSPMDVNHAVLAVGYGVEDGIPYWLIKNSWGTHWGDDGYFKMELGKNMCGRSFYLCILSYCFRVIAGVATCASCPTVSE
ncbi:hypothetical protein Taro_050100 [Colocasia esculenta]|uniref:Uncharacterized protein n=1 Tax=Colocasia esculenta TaxID=4460 RepID=A0A843XCV9_COLES|nr:hypothetical protein [Colocasia esculenta]